MQKRKIFTLIGVLISASLSLSLLKSSPQEPLPSKSSEIVSGKFSKSSFKTDSEWKKILTPEQYYILRKAGTETPYTGNLNDEKRKGTYYSVGCDKPLFSSEQVFPVLQIY